MKPYFAIIAAFAIAATAVHSQILAPKPRNAIEVLRKIRDDNDKLLQRQTDVLKKLEEIETTAKAVKIFAARG